MYDLLTGQSPFHSNRGKKETKERILRGKFTIPPFITRDAADLLRRLIRRNVDRRLGGIRGAQEVKAHPFFSRVDWKLVLLRAYPPPHVPEIDSADETDVSQFDPRFTSRTPRESQRDLANQQEGVTDGSGQFDNMFGNFEYVSPECVGAMIQLGEEEEEEDDDEVALEVVSRVSQLQLSLHELQHMRSHGD
jgi:serine/threonine protein kinase